jgi:uncharacterized protein (TIGR02996 family)
MTERDAFLKAIRDSPDDDTPRLVFADWLTENGEESRAEFIRVQCELERVVCSWVAVGGPSCDRWLANGQKGRCSKCRGADSLRAREGELLRDGNLVLRMWPPGITVGPNALFRRGFAEWVRCPGDDWARHGDAVLAEHPVREVVVAGLASVSTHVGPDGRPTGNRLDADPEGRVFDYATARAALTAAHGSWVVALDEGATALALLRLRWPGVTFRYAGAAG